MRMEKIFGKPILVDHTYDYAGTIYKLIASGASGELQFALVESKPSSKMYILPLNKITNVTEDYVVIDNRQDMADFEIFQGIAKGEYLILDENTANRADIDRILERRLSADKSISAGPASYLSFMQPESQPEPVGIGAPYNAAGASKTGGGETRRPMLDKGWGPQPDAEFFQPAEETRQNDMDAYFPREDKYDVDDLARLKEKEERLRIKEELLRNEELRLSRESEHIKAGSARLRDMEMRTDNLNQMEEKLHSAEGALTRREERLRASEETLVQREERLRSAEETIAQREERLRAAEETIAQREQNLHSDEEMIAQREERLRVAEKTFAQREEMLHTAEESIAQREERLRLEETRHKTVSSEIEAQSEEYRRLRLDREREKADLEGMISRRESLAREIEQMKAMAEQNARAGGAGEDQDITRLFMLQEERLKKAAQAGGWAQGGNFAAAALGTPIQGAAPPGMPIQDASTPRTPIQEANPGMPVQNQAAPGMTFPNQAAPGMTFPNQTAPGTPVQNYTPPGTSAQNLTPPGTPALNTAPINNASMPEIVWNPQSPAGFMPQPGASASADSSLGRNSAPERRTETDSTDMVQNYINKQRGAVIGKTLTINISDNSGNVLVSAGTVITDQIFDMVCAQRRDAIIELAMYAR